MGKCGRQNMSIKFFLRSETNPPPPPQKKKNLDTTWKFWSPVFLLRLRTKRTPLGPQRRFFCQNIRLNTNTLIIYTPTTKKPRRTNRADNIHCFVRLPNVSSQLCTLSYMYLYLLKKKCTKRKTAVWFFALCPK